MTTDVDPLLTTQDLSELLGRSADWWARRARAKKVPHVRIGKSIRFTAAHVEQIVKDSEVPAKSTPAPRPAPDAPMGLTPRSAAAARRRAGKAVA